MPARDIIIPARDRLGGVVDDVDEGPDQVIRHASWRIGQVPGGRLLPVAALVKSPLANEAWGKGPVEGIIHATVARNKSSAPLSAPPGNQGATMQQIVLLSTCCPLWHDPCNQKRALQCPSDVRWSQVSTNEWKAFQKVSRVFETPTGRPVERQAT